LATLVKVFAGEYDLVHRAALQAEFDALSAEPHAIVLDMSAVTYLDSSFVTELIRLHKIRAAHGYERLTIVRVAPIVKRIFHLLYMGTFCRMVDTLAEALPNDGKPVVVQHACHGSDPVAPPPLTNASSTDAAWVVRVLAAAGA
jgi:anti-anti-sigma factor